jgi:hypothetical protein
MISAHTKAALQAAKARGARSLRAIAAALNSQCIETPRGGKWSAVQVSRVLAMVSPPSHSAPAFRSQPL